MIINGNGSICNCVSSVSVVVALLKKVSNDPNNPFDGLALIYRVLTMNEIVNKSRALRPVYLIKF